ncbi:MAG: MDR family MFS transporter [Hyphomicrobiales bacterium]
MLAARPLGETLDQRQRWLLLGSLMLSMFIGALDQTIMSTATPNILADLGGFALLSWVFTTYMLASTVVVPLVGKLSDIFGRKIFIMCGIITFMAASAACGAAVSMPMLIAARAAQGIGGGMIFASVFSTIGDIFTPVERGKYMGLFTGTFTLASVLGPTIGGLLTDHAGWRWVFYINVPFSLMALPAVWRNLPSRPSGRRPKIDFLGSALLSACTVSLLLALVWAGEEYGWGAPLTLALLAAAAVLAVAFTLQERRHPEPIIPLHLFRNRIFLLSNLIVFTLGAGMFAVVTYLPTFVQTAMGASATASGLITTPQSIGVLITSIVGGQLMTRTGRYRAQSIFGAVMLLCSMSLLLTLGVGTPKWHVSAFMVLLGLGSGLVMPTMSVVIQNAVAHEYLGVATSSRQFFMQIGSVMGTAIFGVLLATSYHSAFTDNVSPEARQEIPAATFEKFNDPTLALDEGNFAIVQAETRNLPGGEALLADAVNAQKEGITVAMHHIIIGGLGLMALTLALCCLLQEVPLRRAFGSAAGGEGGGSEAEPLHPAIVEI